MRLKKHHFLAAQISTEIKYASFRSVSHQTTILTPTAEEAEIYQCACQLFDELWDGEPIRLLGIRTTKLQDEEEPTQISLFDLIKYLEEGEPDENGVRTLTFQVNGMLRTVKIQDKNLEIKADRKLKADKTNPQHLGSSIPGTVGKVLVKEGDAVTENEKM